jgi:hypothetical protein
MKMKYHDREENKIKKEILGEDDMFGNRFGIFLHIYGFILWVRKLCWDLFVCFLEWISSLVVGLLFSSLITVLIKLQLIN